MVADIMTDEPLQVSGSALAASFSYWGAREMVLMLRPYAPQILIHGPCIWNFKASQVIPDKVENQCVEYVVPL